MANVLVIHGCGRIANLLLRRSGMLDELKQTDGDEKICYNEGGEELGVAEGSLTGFVKETVRQMGAVSHHLPVPKSKNVMRVCGNEDTDLHKRSQARNKGTVHIT